MFSSTHVTKYDGVNADLGHYKEGNKTTKKKKKKKTMKKKKKRRRRRISRRGGRRERLHILMR